MDASAQVFWTPSQDRAVFGKSWSASAQEPLLQTLCTSPGNLSVAPLPEDFDIPSLGKQTTGRKGCARLSRNLVVAMVACFMGATDGVSLGNLIFPSSKEFPNPDYKALGMSIGLLTTFVANAGSLVGSQLEFSVGGVNIPAVMVLASFFSSLGPEMCPTIFVMAVIATAFGGVIIWLVGYAHIARVAKACPYVVYGGFMAGTGVALFQCGLNLMCPTFVSMFEFVSYSNLLQLDNMHLWVPGTLAGISLFVLKETGVTIPGISRELLVPAALALLAGIFFSGLWLTGLHLEDARSAGWLFQLQIPSQPVFYHVWTKQVAGWPSVDWMCLLSVRFWFAVLNSALISVLTIVMNIYGCARSTSRRIDMDKETMLHGAYNVGSGVVSGLPCNMVMSFAVTCKLLGADGRQFQILLSALSLLTFIFGDYILAVLPKLLPGTVLIWLSFELAWFWVTSARSFLLLYEYLLIWLMIFLYVYMGSGSMMLVGIVIAIAIVITQSSRIPIVTSRKTLVDHRSTVIRTVCDQEYLRQCIRKVEVWAIGTPHLYFASVGQLVDLFEALSSEVAEPQRTISLDERQQEVPAHVVLDFEHVRCLELTALSALMEALDVAGDLGCTLTVARPSPEIMLQFERFFFGSILFVTPECLRTSYDCHAGGSSCSRNLIKQYVDAKTRKKPTLYCAETLDSALQWVEAALLSDCVPPAGRCRGGANHLHDVHKDLSQVTSRSNPFWGIWEDFHIKLSGKTQAYSLRALVLQLQSALQTIEFAEGAIIYKVDKENFNSEHSDLGTSDKSEDMAPPLVWLLWGEVEHTKNEACGDTCATIPLFPRERGHSSNRWEIGIVSGESTCAGPFRTVRAFLAGTAHPGILSATRHSRVALLTRSRYNQLSAEIQKLLHRYLLGEGALPGYF